VAPPMAPTDARPAAHLHHRGISPLAGRSGAALEIRPPPASTRAERTASRWLAEEVGDLGPAVALVGTVRAVLALELGLPAAPLLWRQQLEQFAVLGRDVGKAADHRPLWWRRHRLDLATGRRGA
jgi:hypothetical protein